MIPESSVAGRVHCSAKSGRLALRVCNQVDVPDLNTVTQNDVALVSIPLGREYCRGLAEVEELIAVANCARESLPPPTPVRSRRRPPVVLLPAPGPIGTNLLD